MKTERQILDRLEEAVNFLNSSAEKIPKDFKVENLPIDDVIKITTHLTMIFVLGWMLDCEKELEPILTKCQVAVLVSKVVNPR